MKFVLANLLRVAFLPFAAGAAFAPGATAPAPDKAEQVNSVAVQAAAGVAQTVMPQFAGLIQWAAAEEPIVFGLIYALLHAHKASKS